MNDAAVLLLASLGRTTLWLAAAGVSAAVLLRVSRSQWPTAHRAAWLFVLLIGWTFLRVPVVVPWYETAPAENLKSDAVELTSMDLAAGAAQLEFPPAAAVEPQSPVVIDMAEADSSPAMPIVSVPRNVEPSPEVAAVAEPADDPVHDAASGGLPWVGAINWPRAAIGVWLAGMWLLVALWLVGYVRFVRLLRDRRPADAPSQAAWRELLVAAGIKRTIPLSVSPQYGPMLCRLPRGYELIVPAELWNELDGAGQGAILRHELAHYQRGDVWKSLVARLLALPHWFNPVAWLAVRRFEEAAEWACDRAAVADAPATEYAKLLVHLGQSPHALGYGSSARGRSLAGRVRRVLAGTEQEDTKMKKAVLLTVGLLIAATSVVQLDLVAKEPKGDLATEGTEGAERSESREQAPNEESTPTQKGGTQTDRRTYRMIRLPLQIERLEAELESARAETQRAQALHESGRAPAAELKEAQRTQHQLESKLQDARDQLAIYQLLSEREQSLENGSEVPSQANAAVAEPARNRATTQRDVDAALQAVDLEIKLAELRGQYEQTKIEIKTAENTAAGLQRQRGAVSTTEVMRALGEVQKLKAKLNTLNEQITLHEKKRALLNAAESSEPDSVKDETSDRTPAARRSDNTGAQPVLHYAGKDFDAWRAILLNDLDPTTRTEAVRALAAFANHGYGRAAAEAIVDVFKDFKPVPYDGSPMGNLRQTALNAFSPYNYGAMMQIPQEDALPVILDALKSDVANQRLFAVLALQSWHEDEKIVLPLTIEKLSDPDAEVRRNAAIFLVKSHPDTPGLLEVMREWLSPQEDQPTSQMAISTLNQAAPELQAKLAPELVQLLDRENQWASFAEGGMGGMEVQIGNSQNAGPLLRRIGQAAIPALEQGAKSDDEVVRQKSQALLDELRKKAAGDEAGEPKP